MPKKHSERASLLVLGEPLGADYLHIQSHKLLFLEGKRPEQVIRTLVGEGADPDLARLAVKYQVQQFNQKRKERGRMYALTGVLWFIGGAVLIFFDVGFIFLGAVVFGGWRVISGLIKLSDMRIED